MHCLHISLRKCIGFAHKWLRIQITVPLHMWLECASSKNGTFLWKKWLDSTSHSILARLAWVQCWHERYNIYLESHNEISGWRNQDGRKLSASLHVCLECSAGTNNEICLKSRDEKSAWRIQDERKVVCKIRNSKIGE